MGHKTKSHSRLFQLQVPNIGKIFIMRLLILSTCLLASTLAIDIPYYSLEEAEQYFDEFINTYSKIYIHSEEKLTRFQIFKENLKKINNFNSFNRSIHGITQFTDFTDEEFSEQYNSCLSPFGFGQNSCKVVTDAQINTGGAPETLDYRQRNAVSSVKNQNTCQCCWAFSTAGSLEGTYAIKNGQLISFSAQQLMDCLESSGHCARGGFMTYALSELIYLPGVMLDTDYPFVSRDLQCQFQPSRAKVRVTGCLNFNLNSEEKLKEALVKFGPIAIAIDSKPIARHTGGIVTASCCPAGGTLGHAVLLVGYGTEGGQDYWLIKNSWGTSWGEQGYVRFARGQNVCSMMNNLAAVGTIA